MKQRLIASAIFALFAFSAPPSFAQISPTILPNGCGTGAATGSMGYLTVDTTLKLCVNATVTASVSPFTPGASGARGTPFTVTSADSSGNLPTNAGAVVVSDPGANLMYCNVNGAAATASDQPITSGGGWFNFGIPTGVTVLHCIAPGGNTTANMVGGSGLATGTGGGGGGSGGAVTLASGAVASGAYSAGSFAAGALAAGAFATGAGVDGWDLTQGAKADTAYAGSGSASVISLLKGIYAGIAGSIPTGTNTIGNVGADPSSGKATPTLAFLALPATATTQIVGLSGTKVTYVTSRLLMAGGSVNVTFKYGTGTNCGTGTNTLDGPWPLTAQAGFSEGNGSGPVMIVPAGQELCVTTDASVSGGVKLMYQQF